MSEYQKFLETKRVNVESVGFDVPDGDINQVLL